MIRKISNSRFLYILLVLAISGVAFLITSLLLDKELSANVMFDNFQPNADSNSYLSVGNYVLGGEETKYIAYRPVLFSLYVAVLYKIGGVLLLWMGQATAIILASLFLHLAILTATKNYVMSWLGSIIILTNFSIIGICFHGLTEPLTCLFLSGLIYIASIRIKKAISPDVFISLAIIFFGTLLLIRPVFQIPFFIVLIYFCYLLLKQKINVTRRMKIAIATCLLCVFSQMYIVKIHTNEFSVSLIGNRTLNHYLIAQSVSETMDLPRMDAIDFIETKESSWKMYYILHNPGSVSRFFFKNLLENIQADSFIQDYYDSEINKGFSFWMKGYNKTSLFIFFFILIMTFVSYGSLILKKKTVQPVIILALVALLVYLIMVTGISNSQRDRLVLTALPLWIFLFVYYLNLMGSLKRTIKA